MSKYFIVSLSIITIMNEELDIDPLNPPSTDCLFDGTQMSKAPFTTLTLCSLQQWAHASACIKVGLL